MRTHGKQYRAVFTNTCGTSNSNPATLTVNTAPVVTTNPAAQTVCNNAVAFLTGLAGDHSIGMQNGTAQNALVKADSPTDQADTARLITAAFVRPGRDVTAIPLAIDRLDGAATLIAAGRARVPLRR